MAILHIAYSLDLAAFNELLVQRVVVDGEINSDLFYELAKERLQNRSPDMQYALGMFRFGEEWMEISDGDYSQDDDWFMIVLASVLNRVVSMSDRIVFGHSLVKKLLTEMDEWSPEEIAFLLTGSANYSNYLFPPFEHTLGNSFAPPNPDAHGRGWLKQDEARLLLDKLERTNGKISVSMTEPIVELYSQYKIKNEVTHDLILAIFEDAKEMLRTAIARNHDMYLMVES